jgi:hypothetical protein
MHFDDERDEDDEEAIPRDRGGTLFFARLHDDAELHVPDDAEIVVRDVKGDLAVLQLRGELEVNRVGGDTELNGVAGARLGTLRGDLEANDGGELLLRDLSGDGTISGFGRVVLAGRAHSDLAIQQVEQLELRGAIGGDLEIEQIGSGTLAGSVGGDLRVSRCAGDLQIGAVGGDAEIRMVRGVNIGTVGSDLELTQCLGPAHFGAVGGDADFDEVNSIAAATIGGDLTMERISGSTEIRGVGGDANLTNTTGPVHIGVVGSDLTAQRARGGLTVDKIGADADVTTELAPGAQYALDAGGDVTLRVHGEVNARFVARAGGEVSTDLPLAVERGKRRHLVGSLGRGEATVTLFGGGDVEIVAADGFAREYTMGEEHEGQGPEDRGDRGDARTWEGSFGGKRFRFRWEQGPGRAGMHFQGPLEDDEDPDAVGGPNRRAFGFEWQRGRGARTYGEYEERLRDLGDKAERVARKAAEQAQELAEEAARKTRETDWEAVGREVRTAITKAMSELEDAFGRVRSEWERPGGGSGFGGSQSGGSTGGSGAQRVRIEQDEEQAGPSGSGATNTNTTSQPTYGTGQSNYSSTSQSTGYSQPGDYGAGAGGQASADEREAQRRTVLEQLRSGQLSLDEAERRLNELR